MQFLVILRFYLYGGMMASIMAHVGFPNGLRETAGQIVKKIKDNEGFTALMGASKNGKLEVVKYLIDKGADINIKDNYGDTALDFASRNGHLEIAKYFIKKVLHCCSLCYNSCNNRKGRYLENEKINFI